MFRIFPLNQRLTFEFYNESVYKGLCLGQEDRRTGFITIYLQNYCKIYTNLDQMIEHIIYTLSHEEIHRTLDFKCSDQFIDRIEHEKIVNSMMGSYKRMSLEEEVKYYTPKEMFNKMVNGRWY